MDKKLKEELKHIISPTRPRPLMFVGWRNGKKVYVRKQSLSYWQLKEKYPPPRKIDIPPKPPHIFADKHHLAHKLNAEPTVGYIMAGCGIALFTFLVIYYLYFILTELT